MKPAIKFGLIAIVLYLISLVVLFPANQVYSLIKKHADLPLTLYQLNGTVWNGSAEVATADNQRLESVAWRFKPMALMLGRAELALEFNKNDGHVQLNAGNTIAGNFYLRNVDMRIPVSEIEPLVSGTRFGLTGDIVAQLDEVKLNAAILSVVRGTLRWDQAGISGTSADSLGDYIVTFETVDESIKGIIRDSGGLIQIDGVLLLKPDSTYQLTASLSARDPGRNDIKQGLRFIGQPDPSGKVSVSRSGNLQLDNYLPFIRQS